MGKPAVGRRDAGRDADRAADRPWDRSRAPLRHLLWLLEAQGAGFTVDPRLMAPAAALARQHLERQVADPGLRARLTPDYTIGCKRILLSSDYYPALQRPNVDLVTEPISEIVPAGVVTADGTPHQADVLVYATGFHVVDSVAELNVTGRRGVKLADAWTGGVECDPRHYGARVPELLHAARAEYRARSPVGRLHDREPGPARPELPAAPLSAGRKQAPIEAKASTRAYGVPAAPGCGRGVERRRRELVPRRRWRRPGHLAGSAVESGARTRRAARADYEVSV